MGCVVPGAWEPGKFCKGDRRCGYTQGVCTAELLMGPRCSCIFYQRMISFLRPLTHAHPPLNPCVLARPLAE
jgi:hypothetical protein